MFGGGTGGHSHVAVLRLSRAGTFPHPRRRLLDNCRELYARQTSGARVRINRVRKGVRRCPSRSVSNRSVRILRLDQTKFGYALRRPDYSAYSRTTKVGGGFVTLFQTEAPGWVPVDSVLICDQRFNVRQALTRRMSAMPLIVETNSVDDGFALLDAYAAKPHAMVLIGIHRNDAHGPEAMSLLLSMYPTALVIAFGSASDTGALVNAVSRGARGLMLWDLDSNGDSRTHPFAIHRARLTGGRQSGGEESPLTEREMQVLRGMSQGRSNSDIGRDLFLSEDTIKTHARRLFGKLGARDRAHAVALGLRNGHLD